MTIQEVINQISIWSILLPLTIGVLSFKKLNTDSKNILFLVLVDSIPQMARAYLGRTPLLNYFYNIDIAIGFIIVAIFFRENFKGKKNKIYFDILMYCGFIIGSVFVFFLGIKERFINEWVCVNCFIFTTWNLLLLLELYNDDEMITKVSPSIFTYLIGLFFYTSCTLVIFSLWHYLMNNRNSLLNNLWIIHDAFNVFMYLLFSIGFIIDSRKLNFR